MNFIAGVAIFMLEIGMVKLTISIIAILIKTLRTK